jgi:hypothetical protein
VKLPPAAFCSSTLRFRFFGFTLRVLQFAYSLFVDGHRTAWWLDVRSAIAGTPRSERRVLEAPASHITFKGDLNMKAILTIKAKLPNGQRLCTTVFEDGSIKVEVEPPARAITT